MQDGRARSYGVWTIAMGVFLAAGCSVARDDEPTSEVGTALTASGTFEGERVATWTQGSTHGAWNVVWNGGGSVGVDQRGRSGNGLFERPAAANSALVRGTQTYGDFGASVAMQTREQLNRYPHPWEVGWLAWHYTDPSHFYYVILKPNGWELGKRDPAYPGGQRFLATGRSPAFPIGPWRNVRIEQTGATMTVSVDGSKLTTFTDAERPYLRGSLALYTESAAVGFDDVQVGTPEPSSPSSSPSSSSSSSSSSGSTGSKIYGVTIDDTSNTAAIVESLRRLPHKPTARVVFDENVPATEYSAPLTQFKAVSSIMGELLDSFYVDTYSTAAYLSRTDEYLRTLGDKVDIWEVGNEINGEWLGDTPTVAAKVTGAFDKVKAAGKKTALTLYYNKGCYEKADHEMFAWTQANIPARMKSGLDYVFISYYEDDCNGLQPDWRAVFTKLSAMFPNSDLGIGECGTTKSGSKASYVQRYYGMSIDVPRYVGGYFWWYFREDMVPYTSPLWSTLSTSMQ